MSTYKHIDGDPTGIVYNGAYWDPTRNVWRELSKQPARFRFRAWLYFFRLGLAERFGLTRRT